MVESLYMAMPYLMSVLFFGLLVACAAAEYP
jgi:hypothetical protein